MQALEGSERLAETAPPNVHGSAAAGDSSQADGGLVYDLRVKENRSDSFYTDTARFSGKMLAEIEPRAGVVLDRYSSYVLEVMHEAPRSRGEYALDLLTLGLAMRRYAGAAERTPGWVVALARDLLWLRRESGWSKRLADLGRAFLCRYLLAPSIDRPAAATPWPAKKLPRLLGWLQATGEFDQETRRLNNWRAFADTLPPLEADQCMEVAGGAFDWFEREAAEALGAYTSGVAKFLAANRVHCEIREDRLFRARPPVEYHLAMVATEVMNCGLREQFERTTRKVVLVPACMRGANAKNCRAKVMGTEITCAGCDPGCTVNRITRRMRANGAQVYIVPHATGFSRWLERWQREPGVGVTAVACLINILSGGYEMRARRIAAQCVPLDYPGCQKHWRKRGIPTAVNEERLVKIVAASPQ